MSYSSGARNALIEGLGWVAIAGCAAFLVTQLDVGKMLDAKASNGRQQSQQQTRTASGSRTNSELQVQVAHGLGSVELVMQRDGHYHADAEINGRSVPVLVDTGATLVALTYEAAEAAGIFVGEKDFTAYSRTANGIARFAPVTIDRLSIDGITVRNVQAAVSERGKLGVTLLGMAFLSKLNVQMRDGKLILQE